MTSGTDIAPTRLRALPGVPSPGGVPGRRRRARAAPPLVTALFLFSLSPAAAKDDQLDNYFKQEATQHWTIAPGGNGGQNKLGKGYPGYEDLGKAGADVYFTPPLPELEEPTWRNRMAMRVSVDYFPLQLPDGTYGLQEDIYAAYFTLLYKFMGFLRPEDAQWVPFLGGGFGAYVDRVQLDTPATGQISGSHTYFGVNACAGLMLPSMIGSLRLVPEVRYHALRTPGNFSATNISYQLGVVLWLTPEEQRR